MGAYGREPFSSRVRFWVLPCLTGESLAHPDLPVLGGVWARAFLKPCPVLGPAVPDR
nr:MAG TPA: hypothetical protein [Caudoviricetes sp.]